METIVGSGSQTDRKIKRDKETIGMFGIWVGDAGDQQTAGTVSAVLPKDLDPAQVDTGMWYAFAGFGELGSTGARPGGPMLGFFPELQLALRYIGQSESLATQNALKNIDMSSVSRSAALGGGASGFGTSLPGIADAMKTIYANDSFSTILAKVGPAFAQAGFNTAMSSGISSMGVRLGDSPLGIMADQYNPLNMYANASYNVKMGEMNGYTAGDPVTGLLKSNPLYMLMKSQYCAASKMECHEDDDLWSAQFLSMEKSSIGAVPIVGSVASRIIHVDAQTGERNFGYTHQDWSQAAVGLIPILGNYINSQKKWSEDGSHTIGHLSGTEKDAALIRSILGIAPIIGGTMSEYAVQQWEGENLSGLKNMAFTGLEGMGNIASLIILAFSLSNANLEGGMKDIAADAAAQGAMDFGATNSMAQIFQGIGVVLEDLLKKGVNYVTGGLLDMLSGKMNPGEYLLGKYGKMIAQGMWDSVKSGIAGLFGGGEDAPFRSDEELQKYMLEKKLAQLQKYGLGNDKSEKQSTLPGGSGGFEDTWIGKLYFKIFGQTTSGVTSGRLADGPVQLDAALVQKVEEKVLNEAVNEAKSDPEFKGKTDAEIRSILQDRLVAFKNLGDDPISKLADPNRWVQDGRSFHGAGLQTRAVIEYLRELGKDAFTLLPLPENSEKTIIEITVKELEDLKTRLQQSGAKPADIAQLNNQIATLQARIPGIESIIKDRQGAVDGVKAFIFNAATAGDDGKLTGLRLCKIISSFLVGVADDKLNVNFAEYFITRLRTGTIANTQYGPVWDRGGDPFRPYSDFIQGNIPISNPEATLNSTGAKTIQVWGDTKLDGGGDHFFLLNKENGVWINRDHSSVNFGRRFDFNNLPIYGYYYNKPR